MEADEGGPSQTGVCGQSNEDKLDACASVSRDLREVPDKKLVEDKDEEHSVFNHRQREREQTPSESLN